MAQRYLRSSLLVMRYAPHGHYVLYHPGSGVIILTDALGARAARRLVRGWSEDAIGRYVASHGTDAAARFTLLVDRLVALGAATERMPARTLRWRVRMVLMLVCGALGSFTTSLFKVAPLWLVLACFDALPTSPLVTRTVGQIHAWVDANLCASGYAGQSAEWRMQITRASAAATNRSFFFAYLGLILPLRTVQRLLTLRIQRTHLDELVHMLQSSDGALVAVLHTDLFLSVPGALYQEGIRTAVAVDYVAAAAWIGAEQRLPTRLPVGEVIDSRSPMASRTLLHRLRSGATVVLPFDAAPHGEQLQGDLATIPFLGQQIYRFDGPAWLAAASGKPIIFCGTYRSGNQTIFAAAPPIYPDATLPRAAQLAALTRHLYATGETFLREHPASWMFWSCLHELVIVPSPSNDTEHALQDAPPPHQLPPDAPAGSDTANATCSALREQPQASQVHHAAPRVSVVIATRNRPHSVVRTVQTVLAGTVRDLEVIVVDQSDDDLTDYALRAAYADEPRVRYAYDEQRGAARGRNLGMRLVRGEIIAFTDDDCIPSSTWLADMLAAFARHPEASLLFGHVDAPPHDYTRWVVPVLLLTQQRVERGLRGAACRLQGISANMGIRRSVLATIGSFNPNFGVGSVRWSAEDFELHYRALRAGHTVVIEPDVRVEHLGMRSMQDAWGLWQRDAMGCGALAARIAADGLPTVALRVWWWNMGRMVLNAALHVLRLQFPAGVRLALSMQWQFAKGFRIEARTPAHLPVAETHDLPQQQAHTA